MKANKTKKFFLILLSIFSVGFFMSINANKIYAETPRDVDIDFEEEENDIEDFDPEGYETVSETEVPTISSFYNFTYGMSLTEMYVRNKNEHMTQALKESVERREQNREQFLDDVEELTKDSFFTFDRTKYDFDGGDNSDIISIDPSKIPDWLESFTKPDAQEGKLLQDVKDTFEDIIENLDFERVRNTFERIIDMFR